MLPEDERRLQREADIAKSVRGADTFWLDNSIMKAKKAARDGRHAQSVEDARYAAAMAEIESIMASGARFANAQLKASRRRTTERINRRRGPSLSL